MNKPPTSLGAPLLVMAALTLLGCTERPDDGPFWLLSAESRPRQLVAVDWQELWQVGGTAEDTLLQLPTILRASPDGAILYDAGARRVLSFDTTGALLWSYGRPGEGPDEFSDVRDLQIRDGRVHVLDARNARITVLDGAGRVQRRTALQALDAQPFNMVPVEGGTVLLTASRERPIVVVDSDGLVRDTVSFPWAPFGATSMLLRQGTVAAQGDRWAFAFLVGNAWFAFQGREARGDTVFLVEQMEPPALVVQGGENGRSESFESRPTCTACSASLSDDLLWIHHGGSSRARFRLLDAYRFDSGEYLGSIIAPVAASRAAVSGAAIYLITSDPAPALRAYRATLRSAEPPA